MLRLQSFDLYSGKLVVDSFRIVELLRICTACHGVAVGIRPVADMLWTC